MRFRLQNNVQELFNLLSFLEPKKFKDGDAWWEKYSELNPVNVSELHEEIKPYFLRRTRKHELKDLPAKVEVLIPIGLSVVQRQVYKTLLSKSAGLLKKLGRKLNTGSKFGVKTSNILMELRLLYLG
jgi:chromodomain-helicase-DNA-binding protein 4